MPRTDPHRDPADHYLDVLRDGLAATAGAAVRPMRVVVVGAGMAGLTAALELRRAGHAVTVLEAQSRVGGRIQTFREPFSDGLSAEAGAMRLPRGHSLTAECVRRFGLPTEPFVLSNPACWCFLHGRRVRLRDLKGRPELIGDDLGLSPDEAVRGPDEMLAEAVAPLLKLAADPRGDGWRKIAARYDEYSLRDFLKQRGWSEAAIELYGLLNNYESLMGTAFVEVLRDELLLGRLGGQEFYFIPGGMDRLPRAMAAELGDRVRYGARVAAVEQKTASVIVHYRTVGGTFAETADAAVMTVPFPILRHIPITPPLSAGKRKAIRELHYDGATKIFLQFRRRFWETDEGIRGGRSVTDLPVRNVHYPSPCDGCGHGDTGRGVLLASYTWGADSRRWTSLPEAERVARALDNVAELHGPAVRELFEAGASKSWDDDEFAGGAYALFQPGQQTTLHDDIARPEGRLHFAGEHTTLQHAWVEGAVESGLRAAEEIHLAAVGSGRDRLASPTAPIRPLPGLPDGARPKAVVKSVRLSKRGRRA